MQTIKSYFELNHITAQVVGFGNVGYNSWCQVYSTPIALYSGVYNPIKIQCLNSDQKTIDVSNVTVQLGVFQPSTQNELIIETATAIDTANGVVEAILSPSQLAPLDFGFYEVAVTATDANGNVYPVYIDDNYGNRLPATLYKGPVFAYPNPTEFTFVDQSGVGLASSQINLTNRPMGSTTATACIDLVEYTGNIVAQGTMVTIPTPSPTDWANISQVYYANAAGPVFQNVEGSYAQIRFLLAQADPNGWGNVQANLFVLGGNIRI